RPCVAAMRASPPRSVPAPRRTSRTRRDRSLRGSSLPSSAAVEGLVADRRRRVALACPLPAVTRLRRRTARRAATTPGRRAGVSQLEGLAVSGELEVAAAGLASGLGRAHRAFPVDRA